MSEVDHGDTNPDSPEVFASAAPAPFAAVVLAGGSGSRLGGIDKAALVVGGRSLLDRALAACAAAQQIVAVGPARVLVERDARVRFVQEDPPHGGPAAGLIAGRDALLNPPDWLLVLAVDMPGVVQATVGRLVVAASRRDGAFLHGPDGRRQLAGVINLRRFDEVRPERPDGLSVRELLSPLTLAVVAADEVEARDVDTWQDLPGGAP